MRLLKIHFYFIFFILFTLLTSNFTYAYANERTLELKLITSLNTIRQKYNLPLFKEDINLSKLAKSHSTDMQINDFFSITSPKNGDLDSQLTSYSIYEQPGPMYIFIDTSIDNVLKQFFNKKDIYSPYLNTIGVGIKIGKNKTYGPNTLWITVLFLERVLNINFTKSSNQVILQGYLYDKFNEPTLLVTPPYGDVITVNNQLNDKKNFLFIFTPSSGKGKYTLEIMVNEEYRGPKVGVIIPLYIGINPPKNTNLSSLKEVFKNNIEAEKYMIELVNKDRAIAGLKPLIYDELLTKVARAHSIDMAKNNFFAHINLYGENPTNRYNKAGGVGPVSENISIDSSITGAQRRLMDSPGHRANILDKEATHIGIGVYYYDGKYYITQLFKFKPSKIDINKEIVNLFKVINNERINKGLTPFNIDNILTLTCMEHSKNMSEVGQLIVNIGGMNLYDRYLNYGGNYNYIKAAFYMGYSIDSLIKNLIKESIILDPDMNTIGIGLYQASNPKYGENVIWLTICVKQ